MRTNPKARLNSWAQLRFSIIGGLLARPPKQLLVLPIHSLHGQGRTDENATGRYHELYFHQSKFYTLRRENLFGHSLASE